MNLTWDPALLFLQVLPFLTTLVALHFILFRPMLAYLDEREEAIDGVKKAARQIQDRVEADRQEWEKRVASARADASQFRATLHDEAAAQRNQIIAQARKSADARVQAACAEVTDAREAARVTLREASRHLAADITAQILNRPRAQA